MSGKDMNHLVGGFGVCLQGKFQISRAWNVTSPLLVFNTSQNKPYPLYLNVLSFSLDLSLCS